jgi:hypothetical protein
MATEGSLIRVWTDVGARKPVPLLAKIIEKDGIILTIRYLSETKDGIWRYEDDTYEVEDSPASVAEYLNTSNEEDVGFSVSDDNGFIKTESDDDYVPDSDEEEDEEDESEDEETNSDDEIEEESLESDEDSYSEDSLDE